LTAGGRELRLKARPPACFNSLLTLWIFLAFDIIDTGGAKTGIDHISMLDMKQNTVNNIPRSEPDFLSYFPRPVV
jgi:hypothetical protein